MYDYDWLDEIEESELDKKETKEQAKRILESYKKIFYRAKYIQMPKMTSSMSIELPVFLSGHSDPVEKAVRAKLIAEQEIPPILSAVNELHVMKPQPDKYYRKLLYLKYLDRRCFKESDLYVRGLLAQEFPNRIPSKPNPHMIDEWIFYEDLTQSLLAFAQQYKGGELEVWEKVSVK